MNTKHAFTPGPWSLGEPGNGAVGSVYCDNAMGSRVAIVYGHEQRFTVFQLEEERANARLIAAAPDLLEALKEADRLYSSYRLVAAGGLEVGGWICDVRAAIQKATGESA